MVTVSTAMESLRKWWAPIRGEGMVGHTELGAWFIPTELYVDYSNILHAYSKGYGTQEKLWQWKCFKICKTLHFVVCRNT